MNDPFATLDTSLYSTAPQLPLQTLVVLSKALSARMPENSPFYVEEAEQAMRATAAEAEEAMVMRLRESNEIRLATDLALDNAVDGLWSLVRERLRGWARYEKPGLDFLVDDPELELDFETVRSKALRARALAIELFGDGPLEMLGRPFVEQSQRMANLLGLIDADDHEDDLLELAGLELLPILRRCQVEYAAMIDRRSSKDTSSRANLRALRSQLQRRIARYGSLVLTMLDEDEPETRELIEVALQPMVAMRVQRPSSPQSEVAESDDAEPAQEFPAEPGDEAEAS